MFSYRKQCKDTSFYYTSHKIIEKKHTTIKGRSTRLLIYLKSNQQIMKRNILLYSIIFCVLGCTTSHNINSQKETTIICDKISNHKKYTHLGEGLQTALRYIDTVSPEIACGTYYVAPGIKATVSEYTTKDNNPAGFEAHRRFIDIQYIVKGEEKILVGNIEKLKEKKPYNAKNDCIRYDEEGNNAIVLKKRTFAIFYPHDAHIPGLTLRKQQEVKKIVVKVPVE